MLAFILTYSLLTPKIYAQEDKIDSLTTALEAAEIDSMKVAILVDLAKVYGFRNLEKTIPLLEEAVTIAEGVESKRFLITALNTLGQYRQNYNTALEDFSRAGAVAKEAGLKSSQANAYQNKGITYIRLGNIKEVKFAFDSALQIYEVISDSVNIQRLRSNRAILYRQLNMYQEAVADMLDLVNYYSSVKPDTNMLLSQYMGLATSFAVQKNVEIALKYFDLAIDLSNQQNNIYTAAQLYGNKGTFLIEQEEHEKALEVLSEAEKMVTAYNLKDVSASVLHSQGVAFTGLKRYDEAIDAYKKALFQNQELGNLLLTVDNLLGLSVSYFRSKNFGEHKKVWQQIESIDIEKMQPYQKVFYYYQLIELRASAGQSVTEQLEAYTDIKDELQNQASASAAIAAEIRYETAQKEAKIQAQELDILKNESELQESRFWLVVSLTSIGFILAIGAAIYLFQQQKQRNLAHELRGSLLNQIGRDLHDYASGRIGSLRKQIESKFHLPQEDRESLAKEVDVLFNEIQSISYGMNPHDLAKVGVVGSFAKLCDKYSMFHPVNILIKKSNQLQEDLSLEKAGHLFYALHEILQNILKAKLATKVEFIFAQMNNKQLSVTVEFDGTGFDLASAKQKGGMGLKNLEERIKGALKGDIIFDTSPNQEGSVIFIQA